MGFMKLKMVAVRCVLIVLMISIIGFLTVELIENFSLIFYSLLLIVLGCAVVVTILLLSAILRLHMEKRRCMKVTLKDWVEWQMKKK